MSRSERRNRVERQFDECANFIQDVGVGPFRRFAKTLPGESSILLSLPRTEEIIRWRKEAVVPVGLLTLEWNVRGNYSIVEGQYIRIAYAYGASNISLIGPIVDGVRTLNYDLPLPEDNPLAVSNLIGEKLNEIYNNKILYERTVWRLKEDAYIKNRERHAKRYINVEI